MVASKGDAACHLWDVFMVCSLLHILDVYFGYSLQYTRVPQIHFSSLISGQSFSSHHTFEYTMYGLTIHPPIHIPRDPRAPLQSWCHTKYLHDAITGLTSATMISWHYLAVCMSTQPARNPDCPD